MGTVSVLSVLILENMKSGKEIPPKSMKNGKKNREDMIQMNNYLILDKLPH